jgi:hypothetical protein
MLKKILLVLLIILIVIQFIHPAKNLASGNQPNNIANLYPVPADVKTILAKACLDCHSNNTRYRWYFKIQPVDWWLTNHIHSGKEELNFDEFTQNSIRYQYHKLQGVIEQIKKGSMPLNSYLWIHKDAILTDQEKNTIVAWAEGITNQMKVKYPPDSLNRKKQ